MNVFCCRSYNTVNPQTASPLPLHSDSLPVELQVSTPSSRRKNTAITVEEEAMHPQITDQASAARTDDDRSNNGNGYNRFGTDKVQRYVSFNDSVAVGSSGRKKMQRGGSMDLRHHMQAVTGNGNGTGCVEHLTAIRNSVYDGEKELKISDLFGNGISGILYKWVNYGKGWRPRWFVLQDGVVSYYKIHGPNKFRVDRNFCETKKGQRVIGEESIQWLSRKHNNNPQKKCQDGIDTDRKIVKPIGEVHLKVSSIRENQSDDKRFSIFTGMKRLHLRAKTHEDRRTWLEALHAVKEMFPRMPNSELMAPAEGFVVSTDKLKHRLIQEGLNDSSIQDIEQIIKDEFSGVLKQLVALKQKHALLINTLQQLETEKVDLENTVVDESQKFEDGYSSRSLNENYMECNLTESDDDNERGDAAEEESDDEDNEFFDTRDFLSSSSYNGSKSNLTWSSLDCEDDDLYGIKSIDDTDASIKPVRFKIPVIMRRRKLPDPVEKEKGVSLWSMIKDNIGKDLTKVCLPVYFNEPLSSLQKCFEDLEYSYLIDRAYAYGKEGNSLMQILNIAAFAVSGYSSTEGRNCKPFNPLLGETYEGDYPDKGLRFFSEKVSHHPMIVACHCEGNGWKFWADSNLKSKFWGRSIQLDPVGTLTLEFDDGQVFQWSKVTTSIYNLILGKLYCDHYGIMRIQGNREFSCKLKFKEMSIIDRNPHQVQGIIQDRNGKTVATLFGKWDESMHYVIGEYSGKGKGTEPLSEANLLWKCAKPSRNPTRYNLSRFALTLNELTSELRKKLPPTDSRLRPDQRCLENGEYEKANAEKLRLEKQQRQARDKQERGWKPQWFVKEKGSNAFRYTGGYWEAREQGNWGSCPDIFGYKPVNQNINE